MRRLGRTVVTGAAALGLVASGLVAGWAAGTGTVDPPPRIAFVARSDVAADALAVGPIAGRLGAPLFTTRATELVAEAQAGLGAYGPELVIIAGGVGAISLDVERTIETALNLPDDKVVRAAGDNRHATAAAIAALINEYDPAFLPVDATALEALDAGTLDGMGPDAFVSSDGEIVITTSSITERFPGPDYDDVADDVLVDFSHGWSTRFTRTGSDDVSAEMFDAPTLPVISHGVPMALVGLEICVSNLTNGAWFTGAQGLVAEENPDFPGSSSAVIGFPELALGDGGTIDEDGCYAGDFEPVPLAPNRVVRTLFTVILDNPGAEAKVNSITYTLRPA